MKRTLIVITVLLILVGLAFSEDQKQQSNSILDKRFEATVSLGVLKIIQVGNTPTNKLTFVPIGTGVLFALPDDAQHRVCLVTAKHVFDDPIKNWHPTEIFFRFKWNETTPLDDFKGFGLILRANNQKAWTELPDDTVDLAALPMLVPGAIAGKSQVNALTKAEILNISELTVGQPVTLFGFPGAVGNAFGSDFMTLPLARRGIISWLPPSKGMPQKILIDSMAFPGNSGGPVFNEPRVWDEDGNMLLNTKQKAGIIGIVSKGAMQPVDVQVVSLASDTNVVLKPVSLDNMGLCQIEPGDRIIELIDLVEDHMGIQRNKPNSTNDIRSLETKSAR